MKRGLFTLIAVQLISVITFGQITLIGHNEINNSAIYPVKISVYNDDENKCDQFEDFKGGALLKYNGSKESYG